MELRKCVNCGCFITTEESLCTTCANKKTYENTVLKTYFDENSSFDSISSISATTGVSPNVIQSYMKENNFTDADISATAFNSIQY